MTRVGIETASGLFDGPSPFRPPEGEERTVALKGSGSITVNEAREAAGLEPLPENTRPIIGTVYVAGPMTNLPEYNYPAFRAAADKLRAMGYEVVSPVELDEKDGYDFSAEDEAGGWEKPSEYAQFLSRDMKVIVERHVEAIVVLPGWEKSGGARTEVAFGQALKLPILAYPTLEAISSAAKDQGEVRIVNEDTGGEKGTKPERMELIPYGPLRKYVAPLYGEGAKKYADHNWRRGFAWSLSSGALMRHYALWMEGEDFDEETGCHHLASVVFHALALLHFHDEFPELDDRPNTLLEKGKAE